MPFYYSVVARRCLQFAAVASGAASGAAAVVFVAASVGGRRGPQQILLLWTKQCIQYNIRKNTFGTRRGENIIPNPSTERSNIPRPPARRFGRRTGRAIRLVLRRCVFFCLRLLRLVRETRMFRFFRRRLTVFGF